MAGQGLNVHPVIAIANLFLSRFLAMHGDKALQVLRNSDDQSSTGESLRLAAEAIVCGDPVATLDLLMLCWFRYESLDAFFHRIFKAIGIDPDTQDKYERREGMSTATEIVEAAMRGARRAAGWFEEAKKSDE